MSLFDRRPVGWLVGASMIGAALMVPVSTASGEPDPPVSADSSTERRREVISERTESSQTFQNPDGSLTTELSTQLLRFKDDDGTWTDIDTSLVRRGGVWEPKAAPAGLEFSAGGSAPFVEFERDGGDSLALGWPTALPAPVVEGSTLTYRDVVPNGDLTVTALPNGFSHSLVLREAPANPDMSIPLPVRLDGTKLVETSSGGLQVNSADDSPVRAPAPLMWDSSSMPENDRPGTIRPVDATVTGTGATAKLVLTPDAEMLSDPETNYPVTIDPTFTQDTPVSDTYIASAGTPDSCGASAGANCFSQSATPSSATRAEDSFETGADGSVVARSFLRFPNFDFTNKQVTGASLTARNVQSRACINGATIPEAIAANWSETSLTWSNQPTVVANSNPPQYYVPHGGPAGSSCTAHGWGTWGVTAQVQAMANGTRPNYGFRLRAATETTNNSWRRWRAKEGTTGTTYYPKLAITYTDVPAAPDQLASGPCDDCAEDPASTAITRDAAWFKARATTAATVSTLRRDYEIHAVDEETLDKTLALSGSVSAPSGATSTWTPGIAFPEGDYALRVRAWDGTRFGPWSSWHDFTAVVNIGGDQSDAEGGADADPNDTTTGESLVEPESGGTDYFGQSPLADEPPPANYTPDPPPPGTMEVMASGGWWDKICTKAGESKYKVVKKYYRQNARPRQESSTAKMYCGKAVTANGESKFGIRHIRDKHKKKWARYSAYEGRNWGNYMHWAVSWTLKEPDVRSEYDNRYCYQKTITFKNANGTKEYYPSVVILGETGVRIITAFPASSWTYCQRQGTTF